MKSMKSGRYTITDEFPIRPSWCEAALCLEQIKRGEATGNKPALIVRRWLQSGLFYLGWLIQKYFLLVLALGFLIFVLFGVGLVKITIETNIEKLWVPKGGRLEAERSFTKSASNSRAVANNWTVTEDKTGIGDDTATNFQVLIQNVKQSGENILTKEQLLLHVKVLETIANMSITEFNKSWSLYDICFKAKVQTSKDSLEAILSDVVKAVMPCIMLSPLDCFWDGSKPLGPFPPHNKVFSFELNWKKLNPQSILKALGSLNTLFESDGIEAANDLFTRAGVGPAYTNRPCIDPFEPECPKSAPNYVDSCDLITRFTKWNNEHKMYNNLPAIPLPTEPPPPIYDDYYDQIEANNTKQQAKKRLHSNGTTTKKPKKSDGGGLFAFINNPDGEAPLNASAPAECQNKPYVDAVKDLLRSDPKLARQFVPGIWEDYGKYMTGGCKGFATNFMQWPESLIIGSMEKDSSGKIISAGALQTVLMIATQNDVYDRYKEDYASEPWWNTQAATRIIKNWQRKYADMIYNWENNTETSKVLHPLAAASLEDMVEEFSKFNPMFIIVGYILMVIYACFSALSFANKGVRSNATLAFVGCCIVLLANVSGLGCTLILGIDFNATTTQILPFLLLSLGVDEMFLLLNKYSEIVTKIDHDELGVLLRETGLSVLITYVNNILAFFAGVLLPIPALKIFCIQVAIVLVFNLVAIITLFPAAMALDLKRQRAGLVDFLCCIRGTPVVPKSQYLKNGSSNNSWPPEGHTSTPISYYSDETIQMSKKVEFPNGKTIDMKNKRGLGDCTLTNFVRNFYAPVIQKLPVKISIVVVFLAVIAASIFGLSRVPIGLELSEIVPAKTAPHFFFKAREQYFPFYPIYTVMKGPDIDYASKKTQKMMRQLNQDMKRVPFVVNTTVDTDWLSMLTDWLTYAQKRFDEEWANGALNETSDEKPTRLGKIAKKLICAYGDKNDCTNRLGKVRLIDSEGYINEDGFYNYLTAWYNIDQMTYYVSQANFYPAPPAYDYNTDTKIPEAPKMQFSQFPFFVNDINNTVRILEMISDVRGVCEDYNKNGLPVYPQGIPFTFWELYLHLTRSLLTAFAIIVVAVFIAISIMLVNPWISALIVIVLVLMIVVELGFMGVIHIKLNPISAVTLITAVGIRVKFTVHVALSFLTTVGLRNERIARTLEHMFIPVLHGGVSTLVGLVMLAFSKFDFIFEYYFMIMFALVILGILSGLILMPVILSWIGPPAEVKPIDGSSYLLPPDVNDSKENKEQQFNLQPKPGPISLTINTND